MPRYGFNPFGSDVSEIGPELLERLVGVPESWYVDYKRESLKVSELAKHMTAFANQYGGWLIIGVQEKNDHTRMPDKFVGVLDSEVGRVCLDLREAATAHSSPEVYYEEFVVAGPNASLGLMEGSSVIVVGIPYSNHTPHVHSSGRIYRRLADQSKPKEETDRFILDQLWKRGRDSDEWLVKELTSPPELPEGQEHSPWLHVYYLPSPHQCAPDKSLSYKRFSSLLRNADGEVAGLHVPIQVTHATSDGFLARQVSQDPSSASLAFRWYHDGSVRFDIPLNVLQSKSLAGSGSYEHGLSFHQICQKHGYSDAWVVDYSLVTVVVATLTAMYLRLKSEVGDDRDNFFYFKLRNVFYTTPFVDSLGYIQRIESGNVPTTVDRHIDVPLRPTYGNMSRMSMKERFLNPSNSRMANSNAYKFALPVYLKLLVAIGVVNDEDDFLSHDDILGLDKASPITPGSE